MEATKQGRKLEIGDPVAYIDEHGQRHAALATAVWRSVGDLPGCNLVFVTAEQAKTDGYGRQIERRTSVCHTSVQPAPGNSWSWPDE